MQTTSNEGEACGVSSQFTVSESQLQFLLSRMRTKRNETKRRECKCKCRCRCKCRCKCRCRCNRNRNTTTTLHKTTRRKSLRANLNLHAIVEAHPQRLILIQVGQDGARIRPVMVDSGSRCGGFGASAENGHREGRRE